MFILPKGNERNFTQFNFQSVIMANFRAQSQKDDDEYNANKNQDPRCRSKNPQNIGSWR